MAMLPESDMSRDGVMEGLLKLLPKLRSCVWYDAVEEVGKVAMPSFEGECAKRKEIKKMVLCAFLNKVLHVTMAERSEAICFTLQLED